jgi:hypothetical protein
MSETMRRANNAKSKLRARVEHVFAEQTHRMGLFARATTKIGMAKCRRLGSIQSRQRHRYARTSAFAYLADLMHADA